MTAPRSHRTDSVLIALSWALTRGLVLAQILVFSFMKGDVDYYWRTLSYLPRVGLDHTMTEYPTPVVWFLAALKDLAGSPLTFQITFVVLMLLCDAMLTAALARYAARPRVGAGTWILLAPLLGLLCVYRFDMVPAVLVGSALVLHARHPRTAGAFIACGAAVKLWPALLVLPLLLDRERRARVATGFGVVGAALGLASLAVAGWDRSVSPLTWQSQRGLQIESLPATWLMVQHAQPSTTLTVAFSPYNAFELFGPGVAEWLVVDKVLTALGMLAIAVLVVRAFRSRAMHPSAPATLVITIVLIMIVTNKTLSPQYVLWLLAPVAAGLGLSRELGGTRLRSLAVAGGSALLAVLTFLVFPVFYDPIRVAGAHSGPALLGLLALVGRNVLLLVLTLTLCWWCWQITPRGTRSGPAVHQPAE